MLKIYYQTIYIEYLNHHHRSIRNFNRPIFNLSSFPAQKWTRCTFWTVANIRLQRLNVCMMQKDREREKERERDIHTDKSPNECSICVCICEMGTKSMHVRPTKTISKQNRNESLKSHRRNQAQKPDWQNGIRDTPTESQPTNEWTRGIHSKR